MLTLCIVACECVKDDLVLALHISRYYDATICENELNGENINTNKKKIEKENRNK